jgi:BirA family biotin operon repressor/biotin-[acetyl-CoA-carboxylase] ligase
MKSKYLKYGTVTSTNDLLKAYPTADPDEVVVATAQEQTAGRGQRGNSWESELGKNLVFSILICPVNLLANKQFVLSEIIALSIKEALDVYTGGISVKWPNDIYWNDRKISGTLIENQLNGRYVIRCVSGTGININQEHFVSDAPNPVSLKQIIGTDTDPETLLHNVVDRYTAYVQTINLPSAESDVAEQAAQQIAERYHAALYHGIGYHHYKDSEGIFSARIDHVEPSGQLLLVDDKGRRRSYAFKEVQSIIGE